MNTCALNSAANAGARHRAAARRLPPIVGRADSTRLGRDAAAKTLDAPVSNVFRISVVSELLDASVSNNWPTRDQRRSGKTL